MITNDFKYALGAMVVLVLGMIVATVALQRHAGAAITYSQPVLVDTFVNHTFFTATTTTATSTNDTRVPSNQVMRIDGAKKVTMYFGHGGAATTSTAGAKFNVQVSPDGSAWYDFNKLVGSDISSTATSSVTVQGATTTVVASLVLTNDTFRFLRCIATEVGTAGTQGEHTCAASANH